ncbi:MAG: gamma-glutamyl-gamma-aminobutyrate hydrolase family protein [Hespellia sp.]|nr:gamma-glutamyl-gamma-aminobutyrate hydrolase family protein [Hespellia sp.]
MHSGSLQSSSFPSPKRKPRPVIGIVMCALTQERQYVTDTYITAVKRGGGLPVVLPLVHSFSCLRQYVLLCDGFLFCGGGDVSPLLFGRQPHSDADSVNISLDIFQIRLMQNILSSHKPVLAICRGMQVLNIALGGTIYQDLSLRPQRTFSHMQNCPCRQDPSHLVKIRYGTQLYRQLKTVRTFTNSYHHQAVHRLGRGLIVSAHSADHVIEGIELPHETYVLGVQWHPECMLTKSGHMEALFSGLIAFS